MGCTQSMWYPLNVWPIARGGVSCGFKHLEITMLTPPPEAYQARLLFSFVLVDLLKMSFESIQFLFKTYKLFLGNKPQSIMSDLQVDPLVNPSHV